MKQVVSKDGRAVCVTTVPYPADVVTRMKKAGYKVKTYDEPDLANKSKKS